MIFNKKVALLLPFIIATPIVKANSSVDNSDLFTEESLPVVLSATRLRQSQHETPASVTIIDREQIKASGARNIIEVLRLVPGTAIFYSSGSTPDISIHSLLTEYSRRLQVMVDGQSIFKPGLSRVLWNNLPINVDEIERIEVVRGPNTSSYGSNAFLGVINIITRNPSDAESHSASFLAGNHGIADAHLRIANHGEQFSYKLSAGYQQDDGFTGIYEGEARKDDHNRQYIRADFSYQPDLKNQWRLTFGHAQAQQTVDLLENYQVNPTHPLKVNDTSLNLNWQHNFHDKHSLSFHGSYAKSNNKERWKSCPPALLLSQELGNLYNLDPAYSQALIAALSSGNVIPTPTSAEVALAAQQTVARANQLGTSMACGTANQDFSEEKWALELVDQYEFNPNFRLVTGLGLRKDKIKGESFFDGEPENSTLYLFSNFEWRIASKWLLNSGFLYEHDDYVDSVISPRAALNYLMSNNSTFRLVAAKGVRTPDFYEQVGHRHYQLIDLDTPVNGNDSFATYYLTPQSAGNLYEETIYSYEMGWFYHNQDLSFDARIFQQTVKNAIDGLFGLNRFNPENTHDFKNKGIDLQLQYQLSDKNKLWASFSLQDHDLIKGRVIDKQFIKHTSSLMYQHKLDETRQFSTAYYNQTMLNSETVERLDLRYAVTFKLENITTEIDFVIQHRFSKNPFYTSKNVIGDSTLGFVRARFNF